MASRLAPTSPVQISFMTFPRRWSLLERSIASDDAGIHIAAVPHTGLSVVAEERNDARHVAAYRGHAAQGPTAAEKQQRSSFNFDRAHRRRAAIEGRGHGRVILVAVLADVGREVEGPAGLRSLQQDRDHEVVEIEMPAVRIALVHHGRRASHNRIGQWVKRRLRKRLRYAACQDFISIKCPQLARFAQHIICDDELTALVLAAPYMIWRVLFECRFIVRAERLFSPVGARYRIQHFAGHYFGRTGTQKPRKAREA